MAKEDGTYVGGWQAESQYKSINLKGYKNAQQPKDFGIQIDLDPGSGTAIATILTSLSNDFDDAVDVTKSITGVATLTASGGDTKRYLILDDVGFFRVGANYLWIKVVLDTSGSDDGDFETKTIFADR